MSDFLLEMTRFLKRYVSSIRQPVRNLTTPECIVKTGTFSQEKQKAACKQRCKQSKPQNLDIGAVFLYDKIPITVKQVLVLQGFVFQSKKISPQAFRSGVHSLQESNGRIHPQNHTSHLLCSMPLIFYSYQGDR